MEKQTEHIEKMILSFAIKDEPYFFEVIGALSDNHFEDGKMGTIWKTIKEHYVENNAIPDEPVLNALLAKKYKGERLDNLIETVNDVRDVNVDYNKHREWMINETDEFIKNSSMKMAIMNSVDLVEKGKYTEIEQNIRNALLAGINNDVGLDYFTDIKERIRRIKKFLSNRLPTGLSELDKIINGGLYTPSLSVFLGKTDIGKSLLLSNLAWNFSTMGKNVVIVTLEIPEDLYGMRIDAHSVGMNINSMYTEKKSLKKLYDLHTGFKTTNGNIFIKEMPPAATTVLDIRKYLQELKIMGHSFDVIMVDYLNLLASEGKDTGMYEGKKKIAEQLRALSFMYKAPVISVSQLNRDGYFRDFDELDLENSSESMGIPATCDLMGIIGKDYDEMIFLNEITMKIIKNKMGAKDGIGHLKYFMNPFSLKMYSTEQEFIDSFDNSGGEPKIIEENDKKKKPKKREPKQKTKGNKRQSSDNDNDIVGFLMEDD